MKKLKKLLIIILCLMMIQVPETSITGPSVVSAATVKSGLTKINGKYYYYKNGKKIKNKWKTIKTTVNGKTVSYRYYFGSNGAAYAAKKRAGVTYCFAVKTINGKKYGFDTQGHMLKGIYVSSKEKFYVFNAKTGVYNATRSAKFNKAAKYKKSAATLRKLLKAQTPVKTQTSSSCFYTGGTDIVITYDHYVVNYCRNKTGKKEIFLAVYSR